MIKCIVTVCGTLSRTAIKRTNREGNPFSAFGIKVIIPDNTGNDKVIEISVAKDGDEDLSMLTIGSRMQDFSICMQLHLLLLTFSFPPSHA